MQRRTYTLDEVRAITAALDSPMAVIQGLTLVVANDAYLKLLGDARDEVEGRPWAEMLPEGDRARLEARADATREQPTEGDLRQRVVVHSRSGRIVHLMVQTTMLPSPSGLPFAVAVMHELEESERQQQLADVLTAVAAQMVAARSEAAARELVVSQLATSGYRARFLRPGEEGFDDTAQRAHASRSVAFAGSETPRPTRADLPVDGPSGPEVLSLQAPAIDAIHSSTLGLFSGLVGSALRTAALIDNLEASGRESQRQLSDTRLLLELARTTSGTLQLRTVLDSAADFLARLLDMSNCFIMLYDERKRALVGAAASSAHRSEFRDLVLPLDQPGLATRCAVERRILMVEDVRNSPVRVRADLVERFGERALLAIPMVSRDVFLGVVMLDDTRRPRRFASQLLEAAEASVAQVALAVSNARLYESLRESYAELEQTRAEMVTRERLAALGELAAVMAHEVRNPLGVIFNAVSSLRRMTGPNGDAEMLLGIIAEESDRLNRIVGDLLDFSRPRALSLELEDVGQLLAEAIDAARGDPSSTARLAFDVELGPDLPRVPMDRHLLRQALVNVLTNAAQAMPQGGKIALRAVPDAEDHRFIRIEVRDQGPGVAPELLSRIFEPFFTTKARGTGLGLAVVKRIVESHRGEIAVRTEPEGGATFCFRLPLTSRPT